MFGPLAFSPSSERSAIEVKAAAEQGDARRRERSSRRSGRA